MRTRNRFTAAAWLLVASATLSACGPDDSTSNTSAASADPMPRASAQNSTPQQTGATNAVTSIATTRDTPTTASPASDPIAQSMQASLAADSQQIAPVMRYAPGDDSSAH